MARMRKLATASPPYERVLNILRYTLILITFVIDSFNSLLSLSLLMALAINYL